MRLSSAVPGPVAGPNRRATHLPNESIPPSPELLTGRELCRDRSESYNSFRAIIPSFASILENRSPEDEDILKSSTIIAASLLWRRNSGNMLVESPRIDLLPDGAPGPRRFKIKVADQKVRRGMIDSLLKHRYAWRGYQAVGLPTDPSVNKFTLAAMENDASIGTITVSFDGQQKLASDESFSEEVNALRAQGRKLCEFTKLAVDPTTATKRVLAALFHVAYIVAHRIRGYDTLLIEVNPRHVRYYERMLGFKLMGSERLNRSVRAPAVLLSVDFSYVLQQIGEFGGHPELTATERSMYPCFFSLTEEASIMGRMKAVQELRDTQSGKPSDNNDDVHLPSDLMPG